MDNYFKFKKKYGQNFLTDNNILNNIANCINIQKNDLVIEIGPGSGALTSKLISKTKQLICFEIDNDLSVYLDKYSTAGAKIIYGDFLKQDINSIIKDYKYNNLFLVANLPYYITTPIITKIINDRLPIKNCVFLIQKEVADRFRAVPGTKNYNSLTLFINYYYEIKKIFDVSRNVFVPKPNVDSSVILMTKRSEPIVKIKNEKIFFKLVRDSFTFKRKTLKNNLKDYDLEKINTILLKYGFDISVRAENLSIDIFADISNNL